MVTSSGIKTIFSAIVLLIILIYAYARVQSFIHGPQIMIVSPANKLTVSEQLLPIEGIIEKASYITLNGRPTYISEDGILKERIFLARGYNIIELKASDRFGRTVKKVLEIIYQ